ncbi:MAG: insulinase family protein [Bacteroidia bacterium]|nr:insulinase family protein [Bacteroidia bacterium]
MKIRIYLLLWLTVMMAFSCDSGRTVRKKLYKSLNTEISTFNFEGLEVVICPRNKDVVSAGLFVRGGTANYLQKLEGIEHLAMKTAVEGGSVLYSPLEYNQSLENLGATVAAQAGQDYSVISFRCPAENFTFAWALFAQAILNPSFDPDLFDRIKNEEIRKQINKTSSPGVTAFRTALEDFYARLHYALKPSGSPESLQALTVTQAREYYHALLGKARLVLVIAGPLDQEKVEEHLGQTLSDLPPGYWKPSDTIPVPVLESGFVSMEANEGEEEVIGIFSAPLAGSREALAFELAMLALNEHLDPEGTGRTVAGYLPWREGCGYLRIKSNNLAGQTGKIVQELNLVLEEGFSEREIEEAQALLHTAKALQAETSAGTVEMLGRATLEGDWRNFAILWKEIPTLKKKTVDAEFRQWIRGIKWYAFASAGTIDPEILKLRLK